MNIVIDIKVEDELEKKELEKYLIEQAKKFLNRKKETVELVEMDYNELTEEQKEIHDELFDEDWNVRDFSKFKNIENVF